MTGEARSDAHDCELSEIFRLEDSFVVAFICDICGAFWTMYGQLGNTKIRCAPRNSLREALIKELWVHTLRDS